MSSLISRIKKLLSRSSPEPTDHARTIDQYRAIAENLTAAVLVFDDLSNVVFANRYSEVLTGKPVRDLLGTGFRGLVHTEERGKHDRAVRLAQLGENFQYRLRVTHASGLDIHLEGRTAPIMSDDGYSPFSIGLFVDVTGSVRYEQLVEEKNRELQDFGYMISHDLRSPLMTLKGFLSILQQDRANLSSDSAEAVHHMGLGVTRLEQLIDSIIEYSKVTLLEPSNDTVTLATVYRSIQDDFGPAFDSAGGALSIENTNLSVLGDTVRLYRVLANLVGNGLKYRDQSRPPQVQITTRASAHEVEVTVTDNGIGIPESFRGRIFKPFQRSDPSRTEGSGIGLASAKKLTERCGGRLELASTSTAGSVFRVILKSAQ